MPVTRAIAIATVVAAIPAIAGAQPVADPAPAAAPAAAAAPAQTGADIDLASLGLDPNAGPAFDDKLNLYGFADAEYWGWHVTHTTALTDERQFVSGNLNLYLAKNLTPKWRFLAEVQFMYLPNGAENPDGTESVTSAGDPNDYTRPVSWGAIQIERAYIEYDVDQYLTVRAGRYLTPYGIWNIDHGSPVIITATRPYIIGEQFFPDAQTGLDLFGNVHVGEYRLGYHATVSNGRNPADAIEDPDKKLAFGGRVEFEAPWAGTLKLGASVYGGRFTDAVTTPGEIPDAYEERSYGGDIQWDHGGLHLQGEIIGNSRRYLDGQRALTATGFIPDGTQYGYYGLAGYRTSLAWNVMPYAYYEYENPLDKEEYDHIRVVVGGLNFRPSPNVVLKLEGGFAWMRDGGVLGGTNFDLFTSQVAWAF